MRPFLFLLMLLLVPTAYACGPDSDCILGDRSYRISIPEGATAPVGAVIWAHGYRGSAEGVMRNASLRKMLHAQGLALIAAQGVGGTWALPNGPRTPDSTGAAEFAYFNAVIADAKARFGIDPARLVASGFSAGGMMVWNLACAQPDVFAGFVPVSGTFWLQPPAQCASPAASIVHLHGGFDAPNSVIAGPLRCDRSSNKAGEILEFCLFEGGHSFRTEYLAYALERLKAAGRL